MKRPVSNEKDRIDLTVDQRMKVYVVYNAEEHDQTRTAFKELERLVINKKQGYREVMQEVAIVILYVGMVILLTGC